MFSIDEYFGVCHIEEHFANLFVRKLRIGVLLSSWPQVQLRGAIRRHYRIGVVKMIE